MFESCIGCEHHRVVSVFSPNLFSDCTKFRQCLDRVQCMTEREQEQEKAKPNNNNSN